MNIFVHGVLSGAISSYDGHTKMHMLEKHVVDWINEWKVGFGLMGEQGQESIHAYFNNLKASYRNIPDGVERLRCMMRTHFAHVCTVHNVPPSCEETKEERFMFT